MKIILLILSTVAGLFGFQVTPKNDLLGAFTVIAPQQGGTGTSTISAADVGRYFKACDDSPFTICLDTPAGGAFNGFLTSPLYVTNGTTTSTLRSDGLYIATSTSNMEGLFSIDSSGNISTSGTFNMTGATFNATNTTMIVSSTNPLAVRFVGIGATTANPIVEVRSATAPTIRYGISIANSQAYAGTFSNSSFTFLTNQLARYVVGGTGTHAFSGSAISGNSTWMTFSPPSYSGVTADTPVLNYGAITYGVSGGNKALIRPIVYNGLTFSASAAGTVITTGILMDIAQPVDGSNVTVEQPYSLRTGNFWANGSFRLKDSHVSSSAYTITATSTDHKINQHYGIGASTITLPPISKVGSGFEIIVSDSAYNAAAANITVARTGSDRINNAAADFVINTNGDIKYFYSNSTTLNWEVK